ncbi:MAG: proline dehydrogenase family protein [Proteobacteria bacterium]|nr:proline dehydrogenase family protein [Pseudomonadota bacterium]
MKNLNEEAKILAKEWMEKSKKYQSITDKIYAAKMDKFFQNSADKSFVIAMMDKAFRPKKTGDIATIIGKIPNLNFLSFVEKRLVDLYNLTRCFAHLISIPLIKQFIYLTTSKYVLFGNDEILTKRIRKNLENNLNTNLNRVGELLLGEEDAEKRTEQYVKDLQNPAINCISIKISTIYSQISSIGFEQTVETLVEKISVIYRAAMENQYVCPKTGNKSNKVVNFDMEEYRDLSITVETFIRALSKPEFKNLTAGIALQAYLPDSYLYLQKITAWAQEKIKNGGAPARVRVVKGANMDMELFEANERNWALAPFSIKAMTDANYKRMLEFALKKENINAVRIGVASHNLFDIAYIYLCAKENGTLDLVTFEMLSGMSEHVSRMFAKEFNMNVLLYLPFGSKEDFISAIGYLVRRLDENTSRDNYLRYVNGLNKENLKMLENKFEASLSLKAKNEFAVNRTQNRLTENFVSDPKTFGLSYKSEADTDFSIPNNCEFAKKIREKWQNISGLTVNAVINGKDIAPSNEAHKIKDHNADDKVVGFYHGATVEEAKEALACASESTSWRNLSVEQRLEIIAKVVDNFKNRRGDLMGAIALETGKPFVESDPEITEAIDFGNFYSYSLLKMRSELSEVEYSAKKTVLVLSPWNFPLAIPAGGIFAGLIAGSNVIFKQSNFSTFVGYELAKCFWDAGVPKDALQFVPSFDSAVAMEMTKSDLLEMIVFTGSTNTALSIIKSNPMVKMIAETGGKNVTIVTKFADKDQAIKNVLHSAFSNSGQKCSATSILALEKEIYEDEKFLHTLVDAAKSLTVDGAWNYKTKVNPLIRKPLADLEYALTQTEPHERWLLRPQCLNKNQTLWTPGLKIGTKIGDKGHMTEFFGPVLTIMKIDSLAEGIELVNSTGYGLTSALESLNDNEQLLWKNSIQAGNLYINRSSTGAVVERQPFGGMNKSAFGIGIKAGGLNYIYQFFNFTNKTLNSIAKNVEIENRDLREVAKDLEREDKNGISAALKNYVGIHNDFFSKEIDYQKIPGQSNITRFLSLQNIAVRADISASIKDLILAILAAKLCTKKVFVSLENRNIVAEIEKTSPAILRNLVVTIEKEEEFVGQLERFKRVRVVSKNEPTLLKQKASNSGIAVISDGVIYQGRVELLNYLQEQSVSNNYHRFGYIAQANLI